MIKQAKLIDKCILYLIVFTYEVNYHLLINAIENENEFSVQRRNIFTFNLTLELNDL